MLDSIIPYLYLISFCLFLFKGYNKINERIITLIVVCIINIYGLTPFVNYNLLDSPDLRDDFFTIENYSMFFTHFIIFNLLSVFFISFAVNSKSRFNLKRIKIYSLILSLIGVSLYIIHWYISGAINLINTGNKALILSSFFSIPPIFEYFLYPSFALYFLSIKSRKDIFRFEFLGVLLFVIFNLFIGNRAPLLYLVVMILYSLAFRNKLFLNTKTILIGTFVVLSLIFFSVKSRFDNKISVKELVSLVQDNPELASFANLEYAWGLRNYNHLRGVNFKQKYPLESYLTGFISGPAKIFGIQIIHPAKRFRDLYHSERESNGGDYGGTGYSLFYEAEMSFGIFFSFIPYSILLFLIYLIEKNSFKSILGIIILSVIINDFMVINRSAFPLSNFIYKPLYAIIIFNFVKSSYNLITPFIKTITINKKI